MPFLIITLLITIHEFGHFLTAKYFNFEVDKIYFYPYGGISKFNLKMNVSLNKELIVLIMGPLFQFVAYFLLLNLAFFKNYHELITSIHYSILVFNFLPIYPLDGGKLLNILFNYKFNFQTSLKFAIYLSYLTIIIILLYFFKTSMSLNIILMLCFLLYKIKEESSKKNIYYNKFLLERYLGNYKYKKIRKVNSINDLYRDKSHIIKENNKYYTEKEILHKKFDRKC